MYSRIDVSCLTHRYDCIVNNREIEHKYCYDFNVPPHKIYVPQTWHPIKWYGKVRLFTRISAHKDSTIPNGLKSLNGSVFTAERRVCCKMNVSPLLLALVFCFSFLSPPIGRFTRWGSQILDFLDFRYVRNHFLSL